MNEKTKKEKQGQTFWFTCDATATIFSAIVTNFHKILDVAANVLLLIIVHFSESI